MEGRYKLFSDPVHGFHSVPRELLPLVEAPEVQRLRRIRQLGVGPLVFPGAEHSRFGHALGAMALLHDALTTLVEKGTPVSEEERLAALAAALLHDVGHGPFSHTLEHDLLAGVPHEAISRALIVRLRDRTPALRAVLDRTLAVFDGTYPRPFFHALVAGQLDVDRLDYLRRDAFYTGVVEGQVGVDRLVKTLRVVPEAGGADARLVVESKGVYAVENFLTARRLMYAQVYLHKTVLAGDHVLRAALRRVRWRIEQRCRATLDACAGPLLYFLERRISGPDDPATLDAFTALDDADVLVSLKRWAGSDDAVLADLAGRFVDRRLFGVTFLAAEPDDATRDAWRAATARWLVAQGLSSPVQADEAAGFYLAFGRTKNAAYSPGGDPILVLGRDGVVRDFAEVSEGVRPRPPVFKSYVAHPKGLALTDGR